MDLASVDHLLTTTRSVRKRLDLKRPVEPERIEECIEIALQAPSGSNTQGWHWLVITDPPKKAFIAERYRNALMGYLKSIEGREPRWDRDDPRREQEPRMYDSARYLAEHLHEIPVHVIPCIRGRPEQLTALDQASLWGSILPAAWSFMLAARARGLGSAWTTLHLIAEREIAEQLEIPEHYLQAALLPVAYFEGSDLKPARRIPGVQVTSWNTWGARR